MSNVALFLHLTGVLLFVAGIAVAGVVPVLFGGLAGQRPKEARMLASYASAALILAILALTVFRP